LEYDGDLIFDVSKPDGTPRKLLDVSRINNTGWQASVELEEGVLLVYQDYLEQIDYIKIADGSKSLCA